MPGDNGTYKRDAVAAALAFIETRGFWETTINARLRAAGQSLWMDPQLAKRSMQLMAEQVMPRFNAAAGHMKRDSAQAFSPGQLAPQMAGQAKVSSVSIQQ